MKYLISTLIALLFTLSVNAQIEQPPPPPPPPPPSDSTGSHALSRNNSIFEFVEKLPVYKGGDSELYAMIAKNMTYPSYELEEEIEGLVFVQFVVEKDGTTSGHKIVRGVSNGPGLEKEALRLAKLIQFEKPGMQNNVPVRMLFTLPVRFKLD
jgi:periplasmic protein TonB